jgi:hypothetical protein
MPYEKTATKIYDFPINEVYEAANLSIKPMGGKILKNDPANMFMQAQMDKKLYNRVLGDRSMLEVKFNYESDDRTKMEVLAYPLNAVGQKLMFGARPGVVEAILVAFYDEIEKRLKTN